ncbi:hypothetical protein M426DRAFT_321688 [Hypoxylon sp. CI-4A]|nr:hypothetical protein M426DRAFT_321688 [Hypoxylon sp. CI-4A]
MEWDDTYDLMKPQLLSMFELCALIICSSIPSLRQVAIGLRKAAGLPPDNDACNCAGKRWPWFPISLEKGGRNDHMKEQDAETGTRRTSPFGMTSNVTAFPAGGMIGEHGSDAGASSCTRRQSSGITVRTEIHLDIEPNTEIAVDLSDETRRHYDELVTNFAKPSPTHASSGRKAIDWKDWSWHSKM